jgi:hypothetical protein
MGTEKLCDRAFVPVVSDTTVTPEVAAVLKCSAPSSYRSFFIIFAVVFLALIGAALLVLFGWCSRLRHRLRVLAAGGKDVNRDIDPKQLLREDQIQHLISVVPDGEEEDAP